MKKTITFLFLFVLVSAFTFAQVHIGAKFVPKKTTIKPDSAWFADIGIRGAWVAPDLDHDGKPEIIVTDYTKTGRVHVFQAAGNDTVEWIWSSPRLDTIQGLSYGPGGGSTPRIVRTGDLDGDGRGEIIFPRLRVASPTNTGDFLIFEWDGVNGSHKFGTIPSAVVSKDVVYGSNFGSLSGTANEVGLQATLENFEIDDVDGDGQQELLLPKNLASTNNDDFLIIHASGTWDFENQGFATFEIEGSTRRLASTKFGGGSPYAIHPADLDGDGKKELVCHNWNFGDYWVIKVTGADTYALPDTNNTTNGDQFYYQTKQGSDNVAFFGAIVGDLDKDGNDEVYFPWFESPGPTAEVGNMHIVNYNPGNNVQKADSTHSVRIATAVSRNASGNKISSFTGVVADIDRNGKQEILIGSAYPSNVVAIEYNGGPIDNPDSYTRKVIYSGEPDIFSIIAYRDSAGVKDTAYTTGEGFVSKMTRPVDIDGDGKIEIILPYQSLADSITYAWQTYAITGQFNDDSTKKINNPKKWIFRSLESDIAGSVNIRDYTVITPDDYQLNQNYPNPFNPSTTISFVLPLSKKVTLRIYDMLGKEVITLVNNDEFAKGPHQVLWNGRDKNGITVSSGAYIAKMSAGNVEKSIKMMLLK